MLPDRTDSARSMTERRQYVAPPIDEALCEVRFAPSRDWTALIPLRVFDLLKGTYPQEPQLHHLMEAAFRSTPEQLGTTEQAVTVKGSPRMQFRSQDGHRLVTVGENLLAIHDLRPYSGWENFKPRILQAIEAYQSVAAPLGVVRIGVRYINRLTVPETTPELSYYFTSPPALPEAGLELALGQVFSRIVGAYKDERSQLVYTFASVDPVDGHPTFLIDLDASRAWTDEDPLSAKDAADHVEELRSLERNAFEALITDNARALFK
jgi:uncharacterized protein (TIGR04255 family)